MYPFIAKECSFNMLEQQTMEELFDQASPDISKEESEAVKALVRRILQYDPAKRPSPEEILLDPWFAADEVGSSVYNPREGYSYNNFSLIDPIDK
jgi:serine/threonine protein kinase